MHGNLSEFMVENGE